MILRPWYEVVEKGLAAGLSGLHGEELRFPENVPQQLNRGR